MSPSKSKCWSSNNYFQFFKCAFPLQYEFLTRASNLLTFISILQLVEHDFSGLPLLLLQVLVGVVHSRQTFVGRTDLLISGSPGARQFKTFLRCHLIALMS
jgi:hypothetical protein